MEKLSFGLSFMHLMGFFWILALCPSAPALIYTGVMAVLLGAIGTVEEIEHGDR